MTDQLFGSPTRNERTRAAILIEALRAMTTERGCTEAEAAAPARKLAELLERYQIDLAPLADPASRRSNQLK